MCGIVGVFAVEVGGRADRSEVVRATNALAHRGPDGMGVWVSADGSCALGHRRLAIVDTGFSSDQPMVDREERYTVVFNGEIFNFLELRTELERIGVQFRTQGDTEVLLEGWKVWGRDLLTRMNGMWSFAVFDGATRELTLARDRFGIKPMYFAREGARFGFASEPHALRTIPWVRCDVRLDVARRTIFDPFSIEAGSATMWAGIERLPAGHLAKVSEAGVRVERWWVTLDHLPELPTSVEGCREKFRELFLDSVRLRMRSDVPIGSSLSGGFDSSAVVGAMSHIAHEGLSGGDRIACDWRRAFVASLPGKDNDETAAALRSAGFADVDACVVTIDDETMLESIDDILERFEDVYISLPTATWRTYQAMRSAGTVVTLDGHGADELMGGYERIGSLSYYAKNAQELAVERGASRELVVDAARCSVLSACGANFLRDHALRAPVRLGTPFDADMAGRDLSVRNRRLYRSFHADILPMILRNFDRLSMAHGVEVRMPFMDWRLVTFAMALPPEMKQSGGWTKRIAREAFVGLLPDEVRWSRKKVGFNSPMPSWMNGALGSWAVELLSRPCDTFDALVRTPELVRRVKDLSESHGWDWRTVGWLWPYVHMRWLLGRFW